MTKKQKFVAVCSNASCKYSYDYYFDDKIIHEPGCQQCGSEVLRFCPHCKKLLSGVKGLTHCRACKKPVKQDKESTPASRIKKASRKET